MNISGKILRDAIVSGGNNIINNKIMIDELNVFPVPDGDTGTNMSMTVKGAITELRLLGDEPSIDLVSETAAAAMLRSARGNSGVILSLLFRGLAKGLSGKKSASVKEYSEALKLGVDAAYSSVMKPTEGTMLTVARMVAETAEKYAADKDDFIEMFSMLLNQAKETLDDTPNLLPVLKKAGVVDAGGMGYYVILCGMGKVIEGGGIVQPENPGDKPIAVIKNVAQEYDGEIEFTYCTEFIVLKSPDAKDSTALRAYLETIGDSVVVVDGGEIIKVHVHTEHPGKALEEGILFGALTSLKIENMKEQHKGQIIKAEQEKVTSLPARKPEEKYGFVAVASGRGLESLFTDLGVTAIVRGGQTNNPSTDDILEAVLSTPAHNVFVLPNNKNIIMAAEQAVKLVSDRNVIVLQSRTIPQGISAMLSFDPDASPNQNSVAMTKALDKVGTGLVTFAARDSDFEGRSIKKGDILGLENGKLLIVEKDVYKTLLRVIKKLIKSDSKFVTIIYGGDISDETAEAACQQIRSKIGDHLEVSVINGGQPVYYYIVSVE